MRTRAWYIGLSVNVLLALTLISGSAWYFTRPTVAQEPVKTPTKAITVEAPKPAPKLTKENIYPLISMERVRAGLAPLTINPLLEQSACLKAQDMADKGYWAHNAPDGTQPWFFFEQVGYYYSRAGENLLYGYKTEQGAVKGWMNSPSHKANILGDYEETGICVLNDITYQGGKNSLVVQHFGTLVQ